ncbi:Asx homology domain-containing protein [Daldinia caldariorum]|uniref:Asx homology domain-containing protein n=1 Tax=Daldinia caldariorum TaxID=326644 RepID=UPI00200812DE|nr:Asx homology domain-containing protein [Daldinia caldariorum]KAI1466351.1 Asx homology domain-containing protein [Daldinia caldariorum]
MPPRKRGKDATEEKVDEPTRRSTRALKRFAPIHNDSSSEEPSSSSKDLALRSHDLKLSDTEDVGDVINVRVTRSKSRTSSRPSTAKSDATSQSQKIRIVDGSSKIGDTDTGIFNAVDNEDGGEFALEGPAPKKSRPNASETSSSGRKGRSKYDNADEMLTNPRAPLATAKLRQLLCSTQAWDLLSAEEKQQVLAKFPDSKEILDAGTENARPDIAALRNNNNFRHDIARYQDDLSKGWHDPEWIRQAQAAHRKRDVSFYDEYLSARFEEDWGIEVPKEEEEEKDPQDAEEEEELEVKIPEKAGDAQEERQERDGLAEKNGGDQVSAATKGVEDTIRVNAGEPSDKKASPEQAGTVEENGDAQRSL